MLKVELIAHTVINPEALTDYTQGVWVPEDNVTDADNLMEFAGRLCYESWHKPNPETATNEGYARNVLSQKHYSIFEHASATFLLTGVSRSLTHELIRHRHLSYSQLSQRFVDSANVKFIIPPMVRTYMEQQARDIGLDEPGKVAETLERIWQVQPALRDIVDAYEEMVDELQDQFPDATRKQIRETARCILPNATETKIVVSGNIRAWREVMDKRHNEHADAEIQEVAEAIHQHLTKLAPNSMMEV